MTQTQQFDADVMAVEPEGFIEFIFNGKPYACQRTPIVDKLAMVEAGFEAAFDFTIEVRTRQFSANEPAPVNLATISIANVDYRIVATTPDQFGVVNRYDVKQKT